MDLATRRGQLPAGTDALVHALALYYELLVTRVAVTAQDAARGGAAAALAGVFGKPRHATRISSSG